MNPDPDARRLEQLLELARRHRAASPEPIIPGTSTSESVSTPPPGFAARMAAQWASEGSKGSPGAVRPYGTPLADVFERLAWYATGAAATACLLAAVYHHQLAPTAFDLMLEAPPAQAFGIF